MYLQVFISMVGSHPCAYTVFASNPPLNWCIPLTHVAPGITAELVHPPDAHDFKLDLVPSNGRKRTGYSSARLGCPHAASDLQRVIITTMACCTKLTSVFPGKLTTFTVILLLKRVSQHEGPD